MKIKFLQAFNGDSILISFLDENNKNRNILIDGGTPKTYQRHLKQELENIIGKEQDIDLLIVTHIDDDHIGGIKELYQDTKFDRNFIKSVWFNSGNLLSDFFKTVRDKNREVAVIMDDQVDMSVYQGKTLEKLLTVEGNWLQSLINDEMNPFFLYGLKIIILSPSEKELKKLHEKWETEIDQKVNMSPDHDDFSIPISELVKNPFKQDKAIPNGSSIAVLIEYKNHRAIFLGDAHPSVVIKSLKKLGYSKDNKLRVDVVKISHHASKGNTNTELLDLIDCSKYMVSTDGSKHGLPDKEAIAHVIDKNPGCQLYFNYDGFSKDLFLPADFLQYKFEIISLSNINYTIEL